MGPPKKICKAKRFVGKGAAGVESVAVDFSQLLAKCAPWNFQGPRKDFCEAKRFVGKGGTDVISVAFAFRRMPAKGVVFRRGAADRPRTDTPSGTGS